MVKNANLYQKILNQLPKKKGPLIIGISGAYTSGKTSFTKDFSHYLSSKGINNQKIHYDDFHYPLAEISWQEGNAESEVTAFYQNAFNSDKLIADILAPLAEKQELDDCIQTLDWSTGVYERPLAIKIETDTVVLLEGALLFTDKLNDYFDYKIYLDISEKELLIRGRKRDVPEMGEWIMEKYHTRYLPVHRRYLAQDKPDRGANLLIDNNNYEYPFIK